MEPLVVALLVSSMFFDSVQPFEFTVGEITETRHIRVGFTSDELEAKFVICEAHGLTNFRFWYDDEQRPWLPTRFKCSQALP